MITDTSPLVKDRTCVNVYFPDESYEGSTAMQYDDESPEKAIVYTIEKEAEVKDDKTGNSFYVPVKGSFSANLKLIGSQALTDRYYGIFFEFAKKMNQPLPGGLKIKEAQAFFDKDMIQEGGIKHSTPSELRISGILSDGALFSTSTAPHIQKTPHTGKFFKPNHAYDIYSLADEDEGRIHISIVREEIPDHPGIVRGFYDEIGREKITPPTSSLFGVINLDCFHGLRRVITDPDNFKNDIENQWKKADISTASTKAIVQLKPGKDEDIFSMKEDALDEAIARLEEERLKMDDEMADTLDFLTMTWEKKARWPSDMVSVNSNDYLDLRGIKRNHGAHRADLKKNFAQRMFSLSHFFIRVYETIIIKEIEGKKARQKWPHGKPFCEFPAIVIEAMRGQETLFGIPEYYAWLFRPGLLFAHALLGPGRQMALLSSKAFEYDPYRQKFEKRLTRYLSYIWRVRQQRENYTQPLSIETLLKEMKLCFDSNNPLKTKVRLEKALNTLKDDGVLLSWQYKEFDESIVGQRKWIEIWKAALMVIEPPKEITDFYRESITKYEETMKLIEPPKHIRKRVKKDVE